MTLEMNATRTDKGVLRDQIGSSIQKTRENYVSFSCLFFFVSARTGETARRSGGLGLESAAIVSDQKEKEDPSTNFQSQPPPTRYLKILPRKPAAAWLCFLLVIHSGRPLVGCRTILSRRPVANWGISGRSRFARHGQIVPSVPRPLPKPQYLIATEGVSRRFPVALTWGGRRKPPGRPPSARAVSLPRAATSPETFSPAERNTRIAAGPWPAGGRCPRREKETFMCARANALGGSDRV